MHPGRAAAMNMVPINHDNANDKLTIYQHNNRRRKAGSSPQFPPNGAIQRANKRGDLPTTLQERLVAAQRVAFDNSRQN